MTARPESQATICMTIIDATVYLRIEKDRQLITNIAMLTKRLSAEYVHDMFLAQAHTFLFNHLPVDQLSISLSPEFIDGEETPLKFLIQHLASIFMSTNQFMLDLSKRDIDLTQANKTLVYNADSHDYLRKIYDDGVQRFPENYLYYNFESGFNLLTRAWEAPRGMMRENELVDFIEKNQISRILSTNMVYLELMASRFNIYMLAVFKYIGVTYVTLDWDFYGLSQTGVLRKLAFNCKDFPRYSAYPCHEGEWDRVLGLTNIIEYPQSSHMNSAVEFQPLYDDYGILVAAHTRLNNIRSLGNLASVLAALDFTTDDNLFYEYQRWFHCMCYYLINYHEADIPTKISLHSALMTIYFMGISLLKFEAIESLDTDRNIIIYGDELWHELFPEYYQNKHLPKDELVALWQSKHYLHLQVNEHFSYPEPNPIVMDTISLGVPYIGFPSVVKVPEQDGLKHVEYRNTRELNYLIEQANTAIALPDYIQAVTSYAQHMSPAWQRFVELLTDNKNQVDTEFINYRKQHRELFYQQAEQYIAQNRSSIEKYLSFFSQGGSYDIATSRFYSRNYLQKIIHYCTSNSG